MEPTHVTTITDITDPTKPGGYGPLGHGVWKVTCTCGWSSVNKTGARNRALRNEMDHIGWEASIKKLRL